jgi:hypothetical protein
MLPVKFFSGNIGLIKTVSSKALLVGYIGWPSTSSGAVKPLMAK